MLAAVLQWVGIPCSLSHLATLSLLTDLRKICFKSSDFSVILILWYFITCLSVGKLDHRRFVLVMCGWIDFRETRQAANEGLREVSSSWMCSYETFLSCGDTGIKYDAVEGFLHFWGEMPSLKDTLFEQLKEQTRGSLWLCGHCPTGHQGDLTAHIPLSLLSSPAHTPSLPQQPLG